MSDSRPSDGAFARVSGMPSEYFERSIERYPSSDMSALRVFLALRTAARRVDNAVGGWLENNEMTVTKLDVLTLLAAVQPSGMTIGQLRDYLRMTQPNVTFVMQGLEREKLVERSVNPTDRRSSFFSITSLGIARTEETSARHLGAIGAALREVSEPDRRHLIEMLATIVEGFEEVDRAHGS